jgi:hypothetical protein
MHQPAVRFRPAHPRLRDDLPVRVLTVGKACADCEKGLSRFLRKPGERLRSLGGGDLKSFEAFRQVLARIDSMTFEDIDRDTGCCLAARPIALIASTRSTRNTVSTNSSVYFNRGGLTEHAIVRQSTARIATEVMPHFR